MKTKERITPSAIERSKGRHGRRARKKSTFELISGASKEWDRATQSPRLHLTPEQRLVLLKSRKTPRRLNRKKDPLFKLFEGMPPMTLEDFKKLKRMWGPRSE